MHFTRHFAQLFLTLILLCFSSLLVVIIILEWRIHRHIFAFAVMRTRFSRPRNRWQPRHTAQLRTWPTNAFCLRSFPRIPFSGHRPTHRRIVSCNFTVGAISDDITQSSAKIVQELFYVRSDAGATGGHSRKMCIAFQCAANCLTAATVRIAVLAFSLENTQMNSI